MKALPTVLCLLFVLSAAYGQQVKNGNNLYVEGDVSGHWAADTVFVTGDIHLPPGEYLEILPGVRVEFQGYYGFIVQGDGLDVVGTHDSPVVFSISDTTGLHDIYSPDGGWKGITILGGFGKGIPGPVVDFQHVHVEYAKAIHGEGIMHGGGIYLEGEGQFGFYRTTFFMNQAYLFGGGAYFRQANPVFAYCSIIDNKAGHPPTDAETYGAGGGIFGKHSRGQILNSSFEGNWASGVGGGLAIDSADVAVHNNTFKNNYAMLGGAISYMRSSINSGVYNNLVAYNEATFFGGGICLLTFNGPMYNNTVVYNHTSMGGGLYCNEGATPDIQNSIFWGNTGDTEEIGSQAFIWDSTSEPVFSYSILQYGKENIGGAGIDGDLHECLDEDPLFVEDGDHPFQLQEGSPAIMTGNPDLTDGILPEVDLAGNPRVQNDRIDMGAYEFQGQHMFTLAIHTYGQGKVKVEGVAYTDPLDIAAGSAITLEAVAVQDWIFEGWSGDIASDAATETITMHNDKAIAATFAEDETIHAEDLQGVPYNLTVAPNPATREAVIHFSLNESSAVTLQLLDMEGRTLEVKQRYVLDAGDHVIPLRDIWPTDDKLAGGIALLLLQTGNRRETFPVILP